MKRIGPILLIIAALSSCALQNNPGEVVTTPTAARTATAAVTSAPETTEVTTIMEHDEAGNIPFITDERFLGLEAVRFGAGRYEAVLVPGVGANLVRFIADGEDILRYPEDMSAADFKNSNSVVYGIPVLFFPNRIAGGTFTADGRVYKLPLNDGKNHIHGFLHNKAWKVTEKKVDDFSASVTAEFVLDKFAVDFYEYYPHEAIFELTYTITADGLEQTLRITNNGDLSMPIGVGFHTAFRIPAGTGADYKLFAGIDKKWEGTGGSIMPNGKFTSFGKVEESLNGSGLPPVGSSFGSVLVTMKERIYGDTPLHGILLNNSKTNKSVVYEWDPKFKFGVFWNDNGNKGFFCPEPQSWTIDAPNVNLPDEETGFTLLPAGEVWQADFRLSVQDLWPVN